MLILEAINNDCGDNSPFANVLAFYFGSSLAMFLIVIASLANIMPLSTTVVFILIGAATASFLIGVVFLCVMIALWRNRASKAGEEYL